MFLSVTGETKNMSYDYTPEQIDEILTRLAVPFPLRQVKWRVTATNKEKTKGLVAPYADPRAYTMRLNEILTPAGWTCELLTSTTPGVTRMKDGKQVNSAKIITTATLEIYGIGRKSSQSEKWAEDENAVTAAEAGSMKRAASQFGLGKYFYDIKDAGVNLWVPIDERKIPTQVPALPQWALHPDDRKQAGSKQQQGGTQQRPQQQQVPQTTSGTSSASTSTGNSGGQGNGGSTSQGRFEASKQRFINELGQPLYANIVDAMNRMHHQGRISGDKYVLLSKKMDELIKMLNDIRQATADMSVSALEALLDRFQVKRLDLIPNYSTLVEIAKELGVVQPEVTQAA
jgi:hypothetical protein